MQISEFQSLIDEMYSSKDAARGVSGTFMWFMEEVGELSTALREGDSQGLPGEFADVFAWLVTLANISQVDLTAAVKQKYGEGCPGCGKAVCACGTADKP